MFMIVHRIFGCINESKTEVSPLFKATKSGQLGVLVSMMIITFAFMMAYVLMYKCVRL